MKNLQVILLSATLVMPLSFLDAGVLIDFESVPSAGVIPGPLFSVSTQGWTFSSSANFAIANTPAYVPSYFGNVLVDAGAASNPIQLMNTAGSTFSLVNLVAGPAWQDWESSSNPLNARILNVIGTFSGGGTISTAFALGSSYTTFNLPAGWDNLASVQFYGTGSPWSVNTIAFDDIFVNLPSASVTPLVINEVPEPSSLLLLGTVSFVCMLVIRSRRSRAGRAA